MIALIAAATLVATQPPDPRAYRHDHKACQMATIDSRDFRPTTATFVGGAMLGAAGGALAASGSDQSDKVARWNARIEACMEAKGYPAEVPH